MSVRFCSHPQKAVLTVLMAGLALAVAACGGGSSTTGGGSSGTPIPPISSATNTPALAASPTTTTQSAATITLGFQVFSGATTVTIKAGQAVTFDDTNGGPHNLVTGTHGAFSQEAGAPKEFTSSGIMFAGGDKVVIMFPTAGTYHITCTFHPPMQATVTVSA